MTNEELQEVAKLRIAREWNMNECVVNRWKDHSHGGIFFKKRGHPTLLDPNDPTLIKENI